MSPSEGTPLIEVRGARVVREGRTILSVERFDVHHGEQVAILGPNGAGKSTLIGLLTRDIVPLWADPAPVRIAGRERFETGELRRLLGVVSSAAQETVRARLRVEEVVCGGLFGTLGLPPGVRGRVTLLTKSAVTAALEEAGVAGLSDRDMMTLSTGEARRVLIARALVAQPPVLVLDEPCAGLDPTAAHHMRDTIRRLARSGRTVLLVTHHIEDIVRGIERVVFLGDARIVADGPRAELLTGSRLSELFGVALVVEERDGEYRLW